MYVSSAPFEDSTDTSFDGQRDGSREVPESRIEGDEACIAQKRFLRSRQKQVIDNLQKKNSPDQTCNQNLLSAESNKGAETAVKQAEGVKAAVQRISTVYKQQQGQSCQQSCKQMQEPPVSKQPSQQPHQSTGLDPLLYQQGQRYGNGGQFRQVVRQEAGDSLNHLSDQLRSVLDFSRLPSLEEALSPSGSPPLPPSPPPLPLFSRCPFTNQAQLWGLQEAPGRVPLHPLPLPPRDLYGPSLSIRRPWPSSVNPPSPPAASSKPSLDAILCTSLVALTNKHREGKYWFKSGCPTPDPRWPAVQQLMAGPIPGDCDYSELRTAFLSHGQTCHLFIQNNQAWLERNQEKFGSRQVKFGYVVFTEAETAERLFRQGGVVVRRASGERIQVRVKRMDGLPAQFYRS